MRRNTKQKIKDTLQEKQEELLVEDAAEFVSKKITDILLTVTNLEHDITGLDKIAMRLGRDKKLSGEVKQVQKLKQSIEKYYRKVK